MIQLITILLAMAAMNSFSLHLSLLTTGHQPASVMWQSVFTSLSLQITCIRLDRNMFCLPNFTIQLNGLKKQWMMYKNIYRKFIGKNMIFWGCLNQIVGYKLLLMKLLDNQDPILQVSLFTDNIWDCPGPWQFKL